MTDVERDQRVEAFLQSLSSVPWFASAGRPSTTYHVVADAVVGWDDWNAAMLAVWLPRSERLEAIAVRAIGDAAIERIFARVESAVEPSAHAALRAYFARRPDDTENTDCGADLALRPEIVGFVLRDMSWAAVEMGARTPRVLRLTRAGPPGGTLAMLLGGAVPLRGGLSCSRPELTCVRERHLPTSNAQRSRSPANRGQARLGIANCKLTHSATCLTWMRSCGWSSSISSRLWTRLFRRPDRPERRGRRARPDPT